MIVILSVQIVYSVINSREYFNLIIIFIQRWFHLSIVVSFFFYFLFFSFQLLWSNLLSVSRISSRLLSILLIFLKWYESLTFKTLRTKHNLPKKQILRWKPHTKKNLTQNKRTKKRLLAFSRCSHGSFRKRLVIKMLQF